MHPLIACIFVGVAVLLPVLHLVPHPAQMHWTLWVLWFISLFGCAAVIDQIEAAWRKKRETPPAAEERPFTQQYYVGFGEGQHIGGRWAVDRIEEWFDEWEQVMPPDMREDCKLMLDKLRYVTGKEPPT